MGGNREINPLATMFASGSCEGRPPCRPGPLRYLFLAFGRDDLRVVRDRCGSGFWAFGRDDLRVVRYRCGSGFWAFGRDDLRVVRGRWDIRFLLLGGTTSVSSGTATGVAGMTNRRQGILDFNVISKLLAVDTEVDPPPTESPPH